MFLWSLGNQYHVGTLYVLVFFTFDTEMKGCMTTMPMDNHPLAQRSMQFIGISANKLTFKGINIIQPTNNYNIISGSICWNKYKVHMRILDTSFNMRKRSFRFRW